MSSQHPWIIVAHLLGLVALSMRDHPLDPLPPRSAGAHRASSVTAPGPRSDAGLLSLLMDREGKLAAEDGLRCRRLRLVRFDCASHPALTRRVEWIRANAGPWIQVALSGLAVSEDEIKAMETAGHWLDSRCAQRAGAWLVNRSPRFVRDPAREDEMPLLQGVLTKVLEQDLLAMSECDVLQLAQLWAAFANGECAFERPQVPGDPPSLVGHGSSLAMDLDSRMNAEVNGWQFVFLSEFFVTMWEVAEGAKKEIWRRLFLATMPGMEVFRRRYVEPLSPRMRVVYRESAQLRFRSWAVSESEKEAFVEKYLGAANLAMEAHMAEALCRYGEILCDGMRDDLPRR